MPHTDVVRPESRTLWDFRKCAAAALAWSLEHAHPHHVSLAAYRVPDGRYLRVRVAGRCGPPFADLRFSAVIESLPRREVNAIVRARLDGELARLVRKSAPDGAAAV